ncbi:MAG: DNA mismatch repair protein MutS [Ignavibacteriales bacterium]|nr:DNA mismatch repair protein MutS [Ignavibacteriales bacterium]MCF8438161.1 DNA mismatch repair protein MutS [Ignavibacteriales bacterium]
MAQYNKVKQEYPDTILLFRIGDFFETFDDDAKTASKVLGITLTKRSNGAAGDVPLAGFPHHAVDTYLPKLVRAGYRVAICEQVEDPKFAKGIVKREVIEVVTPGVALSDKILDHKRNNYLLAVFVKNGTAGISFSDISTGEFYAYSIPEKEIEAQLGLISPSEILVSKRQKDYLSETIRKFNPNLRMTLIDDWLFGFEFCRDLLLGQFSTKNLKGFGIEGNENIIIAAGVNLNYLKDTQKAALPHLNKISLFNPSDFMYLDNSTKRNLEILFTMQDGSYEGSLFSILDSTSTSMGARLLKKWIIAPLKNVDAINRRLDSVDVFYRSDDIRSDLMTQLKGIGDLERLTSKICTGRVNPRELNVLKNSIRILPVIILKLRSVSDPVLNSLADALKPLDQIAEKIELAIDDEPALSFSDGGVLRNGYNSELDELRSLSMNAKTWIANLQRTERERSNISSLKVSYNKVFGYYIEISNAHKNKIPEDYIRKQTLVNSERYITPELKEYEDKILHAEERISGLEARLYNELVSEIALETVALQENASIVAMIDCFLSFAECAVKYNYVKPVVDDSELLEIVKGRHPVVERILPPGEKYTPNDCMMNNSDTQIILLTGPNMAGKSVYLRQTGLVVLLAQIGSFVPADSARIGVTDRIYTRVGASDNITSGESTFLVEMQEAANILNNATGKSLILLDEIGRGTSTFDGISIAWAITEYLHENKEVAAKTLFATHYHELNEMSSIFPRIKNFKVEVREYGDKVIFLHKVTSGGADHSYGIQVARMAGLPPFVTDRAKEILANLESKELTPYEIKKAKASKFSSDNGIQLNLFEIKDDAMRQEIRGIKIENMTPLDALNKLNELKKKLDDNK